MIDFPLTPGSLARHALRPGVWRILGTSAASGGGFSVPVIIEPYDELAAGSFHASEAYAVVTDASALERLAIGAGSAR